MITQTRQHRQRGALRSAVDGKAGAILALSSAVMTRKRATLVKLARQHRLPSMVMDRTYVEAGGLLSYGAKLPELNRTVATFVDRILNGAAPAERPVERPTRLDLSVNLRAAQALRMDVSQSVLPQATEIIEGGGRPVGSSSSCGRLRHGLAGERTDGAGTRRRAARPGRGAGC